MQKPPLWVEQSDEAHQAGSYHFADVVPSVYTAARIPRASFRLSDAAAVRRFVAGEIMC